MGLKRLVETTTWFRPPPVNIGTERVDENIIRPSPPPPLFHYILKQTSIVVKTATDVKIYGRNVNLKKQKDGHKKYNDLGGKWWI